jgi:hypothetical protein
VNLTQLSVHHPTPRHLPIYLIILSDFYHPIWKLYLRLWLKASVSHSDWIRPGCTNCCLNTQWQAGASHETEYVGCVVVVQNPSPVIHGHVFRFPILALVDVIDRLASLDEGCVIRWWVVMNHALRDDFTSGGAAAKPVTLDYARWSFARWDLAPAPHDAIGSAQDLVVARNFDRTVCPWETGRIDISSGTPWIAKGCEFQDVDGLHVWRVSGCVGTKFAPDANDIADLNHVVLLQEDLLPVYVHRAATEQPRLDSVLAVMQDHNHRWNLHTPDLATAGSESFGLLNLLDVCNLENGLRLINSVLTR